MQYQALCNGVRFRDKETREYVRTLHSGHKFTLEPEPHNLYDPNAIRVMDGVWHIGYVERAVAAELTRELASGAIVTDCTMSGWASEIVPMLEIELERA